MTVSGASSVDEVGQDVVLDLLGVRFAPGGVGVGSGDDRALLLPADPLAGGRGGSAEVGSSRTEGVKYSVACSRSSSRGTRRRPSARRSWRWARSRCRTVVVVVPDRTSPTTSSSTANPVALVAESPSKRPSWPGVGSGVSSTCTTSSPTTSSAMTSSSSASGSASSSSTPMPSIVSSTVVSYQSSSSSSASSSSPGGFAPAVRPRPRPAWAATVPGSPARTATCSSLGVSRAPADAGSSQSTSLMGAKNLSRSSNRSSPSRLSSATRPP